jgi:hypothetical protein
MYGWQVPPPRAPTKSREELKIEREQKVQRLLAQGLLRSERIKVSMLKVAREDFFFVCIETTLIGKFRSRFLGRWRRSRVRTVIPYSMNL